MSIFIIVLMVFALGAAFAGYVLSRHSNNDNMVNEIIMQVDKSEELVLTNEEMTALFLILKDVSK